MALDFSQFQAKDKMRPVANQGVPEFACSPRFGGEPPSAGKKPRQRRRKHDETSQIVTHSTPQIVTKKPVAKKPRQKSVTTATRALASEEKVINERERCAIESLAEEERTLNQVQETVTQYGPTGLKLFETTIMRHEEKTSTQKTWRMDWTRERTEREHKFQLIESYSIEECKQKSHGFLFYDRNVRRELQIFKQRVKLHLNNDMSRAWTDSDFVLRFLFGLPNAWEDDVQLKDGSVPWLACLWSMSDMLALCDDVSWVSQFCTHPRNAIVYNHLKHLPNRLFCINQNMMCGFVTGQLLAHTMPDLSAVMRPHVRAEVTQLHFPSFREYIIDNYGPPVLLLQYEFQNVGVDLPSRNARDCLPSNTCCVLGLEPDTFFESTSSCENNDMDKKHAFCDGTFLRLLALPTISEASMRVAHRFACDIEPNTSDDTLTLEDNLTLI